MAKYGTGELVRFKESELLLSAGRGSIKIGTDGLVGRITGSVETTGEETKYYVEVMLLDGTFVWVSDVTLKLIVLESQIMTTSEYVRKVLDDMMKKAEKFRKKILRTDNPTPFGIRSSGKPIYSFLFSDFVFPMAKENIEEYERRFNEYARNIMKGVDSAVPGGDKNGVSVVDCKMSKSRCVKLLESYRAERAKVKKGRKFERCLRDSVVDEALERAIELLKE